MGRRLVSVAQARRGFGFIDIQPDGSVTLQPDAGILNINANLGTLEFAIGGGPTWTVAGVPATELWVDTQGNVHIGR